jgi:NAD(P)H-hydrate repair Nnr-like enzyme with NAD(P)H-hydrate dehydratase domain
VLAGSIGGLAARGADAFQAAAWGVFTHARAGEVLARQIAPLGFLARELLAVIPGVLHQLDRD